MGGRCSIDGCDRPLRSSAHCAMHWNRIKRHGSPAGGIHQHGDHNAPEYGVWEAMIARCTNPRTKQYKDYGARGITVCDRWRDYRNFIADMGRRPSTAHTIERQNNARGYGPGNCVWETRRAQQNNTRRNRFIELNGQRVTVAQAARELGLTYNAAYGRLVTRR